MLHTQTMCIDVRFIMSAGPFEQTQGHSNSMGMMKPFSDNVNTFENNNIQHLALC